MAFGLVSAPLLAIAAGTPEVSAVRIGIHGETTRIVIDTSEQLPYQVIPLTSGGSIVLEFPHVEWNTRSRSRKARGLIRGYTHDADESTDRLTIDTKRPVDVAASFLLTPDSSGGHRIVIDIKPEIASAAAALALGTPQMITAAGETAETETLGVLVASAHEISQAPSIEDWLKGEQSNPNVSGSPATRQPDLTPNPAEPPPPAMRSQPEYAPAVPSRSILPWDPKQGAPAEADLPEVRPDSYWYVMGQGGMSLVTNSDMVGKLTTQDFDLDLDADPIGFNIGGRYGFKSETGLRIEGELAIIATGINSANDVSGTTELSSAAYGVIALMANSGYEFKTNSPFSPYILGGAGLAFARFTNAGLQEDTDTVFAYQAGLGVSYDFGERSNLDFEYKYLATADPTFVGANGRDIEAEFSSHNFLIGYRYRL